MANAVLSSQHLQTLVAILRTGSFEGAAARLGITQSAVSQRLRLLEEQAGGTLIIRGQPCRATELGARIAAHGEQVEILERSLMADLGLGQAKPRLRIAVNADSLATWFLSALVGIEASFELIVDDQDHSAALLRAGDVVAAVTADGDPVQGCDRVQLGALRYIPTAHPAFVKRWFPEGATTDAIAKAPVLIYNEKDGLQQAWAATIGSRTLGPHHFVPSTTAFVEAASLGLGWGLNPEPLVREALARGELVDLAGGVPFSTPLFWQYARAVQTALAPLTDAVKRTAKSHLI